MGMFKYLNLADNLNMNSLLKKSVGFMLIEILIGFLLVAALLAYAIPNFIKLQMKLNMGLVEQHLRVVGEQMTELMKENKKFPEDILRLGQSKPEQIISSSLEIIQNQKGYQIEEFHTSTTKTSYTLRVCPQKRKWARGDQCFILDPTGVRGLNPWDGVGISMNLFAQNVKEDAKITADFSGILTLFLAEENLSREEKIKLLANLFEKTAYRLDLKHHHIQSGACPSSEMDSCVGIKLRNAPMSTLFYFPKRLNAYYHGLIPEIYKRLRAKGVHLYQQEISPDQIARTNKNTRWSFGEESPTSYLADQSEMKAVEIGFSLKNPVETDEELERRTRNVGKTAEDWLST
jgi:competence protein ComGC